MCDSAYRVSRAIEIVILGKILYPNLISLCGDFMHTRFDGWKSEA
jgi:hypothetical protein